MWKRGFMKEAIVCFTKLEEMPVWSGVFLSARSFVASRISDLVKFLTLNLKLFRFWLIRSVGDLFEGLMFSTVFLAILAKKLLKWQAIIWGSSTLRSFIIKLERSFFLLLFLWIVEKSICQVLRRFFWLISSSLSKWSFFARRMTWLYRFLNFLKAVLFSNVGFFILVWESKFFCRLDIRIPRDIQGSMGLRDLQKFFVVRGKKASNRASKVAKKLFVASWTQFCSVTCCQL